MAGIVSRNARPHLEMCRRRGASLGRGDVGVVEARGLGQVVAVRYQAPIVHDAVGGVLGARQELLQQPRPVLADGQRLDVPLQLLQAAVG